MDSVDLKNDVINMATPYTMNVSRQTSDYTKDHPIKIRLLMVYLIFYAVFI